MATGWTKVRKVALFTSLTIACATMIGYGAFIRFTDIGSTLMLEKEIERKALIYKMYRTNQDLELAIKSDPDVPDFDAELKQLSAGFSEKLAVNRTFMQDFFRFEGDGTVTKTFDGVRDLGEAMKVFQNNAAKFFARPGTTRRQSWRMDSFLSEDDDREYGDLRRIQEFILYEAALETKAGHSLNAARLIRFEARIRRTFSASARSLTGAQYAIESAKYSKLFYVRILQLHPVSDPEIVKAIKESEYSPAPLSYKHLCRLFFFMGSGWFPNGQTMDEVGAGPNMRFLSKLPRIKEAWQLHIQSAAISAYEAASGSKDENEALDTALNVFVKNAYGDGFSAQAAYWALPHRLNMYPSSGSPLEIASRKFAPLMKSRGY